MLCSGANLAVQETDEFVSSASALRYLDCTVPGNHTIISISRVILVRNRRRLTEAALLIYGAASCCQPRLVAVVPLCSNIEIYFRCSSLEDDLEDDFDTIVGPPRIMIEVDEIPIQPEEQGAFKDRRDISIEDSIETSIEGDGVSMREKFFKNLYLLQETSTRHGYVFPSSKGNHNWLWTYGADHLPRLAHNNWESFREPRTSYSSESSEPAGPEVASRTSLVFGGLNLRNFVTDLGISYPSVRNALMERESEFIQCIPLRISTVTLNCGGQMPPSSLHLVDLFTHTEGEATSIFTSDISFVALQETCPLFNAIDKSGSLPGRYHAAWIDACKEAIQLCGDFVLVTSVSLVGLLLLAFAREEHVYEITDIRTGVIGAGAFGLGNKGAVATSFLYCATSICFVNSHLASGSKEGNIDDRIEDFEIIVFKMRLLKDREGSQKLGKNLTDFVTSRTLTEVSNSKTVEDLLNGTTVSAELGTGTRRSNGAIRSSGNSLEIPTGTGSSSLVPRTYSQLSGNGRRSTVHCANLFEHDALIWAGDMNMRLWQDSSTKKSVEPSAVWECLADPEKQRQFMETHDELHILRNKGGVYAAFNEAPIDFYPSYKMKPMPQQGKQRDYKASPHPTNEQYFYDAKRVPAWTDRVLWKARRLLEVQTHAYERIASVDFSDHRPVRLTFTMVSRNVLWDKLKNICEENDVKESGRYSVIQKRRRYDSVMDIELVKEAAAAPEPSCQIL